MTTHSTTTISLTAIFLSCATSSLVGCNRQDTASPASQPAQVDELRQTTVAKFDDSIAGPGWGTLQGTFRYRGAIPERSPLNVVMSKDCPAGPIYSEALVVDPATRGIADVVIYARKVVNVHPSYASEPGKEVKLTTRDCRLVPHVIGSTLKDRFILFNDDTATHNSRGSVPGGDVAYGPVLPVGGPGTTYSYKRPSPFPYDVTCAIHPWEKAWHIIRPDPYFAITSADGSFKIERLPAGEEIEFQVWHESSREVGHVLRAEPNWSKEGRFKLKIPKADTTVTMNVQVDAELFRKE